AHIVLLLAVVRNVGAKGQCLQDQMRDGDKGRDAEQDGVGVDENLLDHLNLGAVSAAGQRRAKGGLTGRLLGVHLDRGHDLELPESHVLEVNVQRKLLDSLVEGRHVVRQLPKGVDEQERICNACQHHANFELGSSNVQYQPLW